MFTVKAQPQQLNARTWNVYNFAIRETVSLLHGAEFEVCETAESNVIAIAPTFQDAVKTARNFAKQEKRLRVLLGGAK